MSLKNTRGPHVIVVLLLLGSVFAALPVIVGRAATVDASIKAVVGYPLIENLPEPNTPPHTVWFGVGVLNEGTEDTYINVTVYLNMTEKFIANNVLLSTEFKVVVFSATTSQLGKGAHVISALVEASGDVDPADNYLVGDTVKISMIADVNFDHRVDIKDISAISARYGMGIATINPIWIPEVDHNWDGIIDIADCAYYASIPDYYNLVLCYISYGSSGPHGVSGKPEWNWACDLYRDGKIDIRDLSIASKHYGEIDP